MARLGRAQHFRPLLKRPDLGPDYFDNSSNSGYEAALSTYNFNLTVGTNSNRYLTVGIGIFAAGSVTGITALKGGIPVALTKIRADVGGAYRSEIWGLTMPDSGVNNIVVTLSTSLTSIAGAASYWNIDQLDPVDVNAGANGTNTPASVSITSIDANNRFFANLAAQTASGISDQIGQVPRWINQGTLGTNAAAEKGVLVNAGSVTFQWNGLGALDAWAASAITLSPAGSTVVTTQTVTGVARIRITTARTITGISRIQITTTRTITGVANLVIAANKTITGVANIRNTTSRTITGVSRIQATTTRTITGVGRIQRTMTATETGISRISITTKKTITGVAKLINKQAGISKMRGNEDNWPLGLDLNTAQGMFDLRGNENAWPLAMDDNAIL